ncbi:MAG: maleylpyruvate isomerase N-terminal domain-containing protein [Acidobacteriota bacterium]|nr:maleylpyruvate isomerase N-terminal domain-containing protein [Acidobacteriota bacterium]
MAYDWITDALEETWASVEAVLRGRTPADYDVPTACPGWSVRDVLSHLLGIEVWLRGGAVPAFEGPMPDHVKNSMGEFNEAFVAAHRDESGPEVLTQFRAATAASIGALRAMSTEDWEVIGWSPEGDRPYHRFMETRVLDSWIHLQDIRDALLEPADDHGPGEEIVVNRFESSLPYVVGRKMSAADGTLVRVNLTGRLARSVMIAVANGRASAVTTTTEEPTLEVTTPVALFWRRCAGRISADAFLGASATDVRGDRELARAFADALAIMI